MATKYVVRVDLESGETYNGESYYEDLFENEAEVREHYRMEEHDYDGFTDALLAGDLVSMSGRTFQLEEF